MREILLYVDQIIKNLEFKYIHIEYTLARFYKMTHYYELKDSMVLGQM